jgi:hypothetical protein
LDALGDGESRTALDLATELFGADASGQSVGPTLRVLERAEAVIRDKRIWCDRYKHRVWLWHIPAPIQELQEPQPKLEPAPKLDPPPEPPQPKLEKGITQEEYEAHLRQRRELADRKAAKRARRD